MLVIKVELHSAITGETTTIARMAIANVGDTAGDPTPYAMNYIGWTDGSDHGEITKLHGVTEITGHPQRDKDGKFTSVWFLVAKMLKAMGYLNADA